MFDFVSAVFDAVSVAFTWCVEKINTEGTVLNKIWDTIKAYAGMVWANIKTVISAAISIIQNVIKLFTSILRGDWSSAWDAVKNIAQTVWDALCSIVSNGIEFVKTYISNGLSAAKAIVSSILSSIYGFFKDKFESAKKAVSTAITGVKTSISDGLNEAKTTVSNILDGIKKKFADIWDNCKKIVTDAVAALKKAMDFSWKLPDLKLPHISVTGGVAPYGIGGKGSLPQFSIEWYKKAYDNAMVLSSPTIFGYSGGKFLGGGDGSGNEIVAGESHLMNIIGDVVESKTAVQNERIISLLSALLEAIVDGNNETVRALLAGHVIKLNDREVARTVRTYA